MWNLSAFKLGGVCGGSSKFKETGGLGCLSLLLCTQEDPDLIESIVSQNVDSGCIGITQGLLEMRISRLYGSEF